MLRLVTLHWSTLGLHINYQTFTSTSRGWLILLCTKYSRWFYSEKIHYFQNRPARSTRSRPQAAGDYFIFVFHTCLSTYLFHSLDIRVDEK